MVHIYIDAPMLEIDETSALYTSGKVTRDPNNAGRFVYHVAADRESERLGSLSALSTDSKATNQVGERKELIFRTKDIVTAGEITISSDDSKVVYYTKKFKIQNQSIVGTLQYRSSSGLVDVPSGSFIPFEVEPTYNRIGTISVGENGSFELRLRSEYKYDWSTDNVKFQYTDANGVIYEKVFDSINALYSSLSTAIILEPR